MNFKTVKEFNKQYENLRTEILERHGYKPGDKVRLKKAMVLMFSFDNGNTFLSTGLYTIVDMRDKIRMYEMSNSDVVFKLKPLV